ncbi:MAG: four helix bundle protein [Chloroflexota bacterium]|nr:four helix bundle protein [Chloroflexota bacterium]
MSFRFEGTDIWHLARAYAGKIYQITARFPRDELYGLASQLNRAVNSIALNVAEGAGRDTSREFDHFLGIAVGSLFEVVSGLFLAMDRGYIDKATHHKLYKEAEILGKKINSFRKTLR